MQIVSTQWGERITQSDLAESFTDELVKIEYDLAHYEGRDYEPTSVLLERNSAERVVAGDGKPKRTKKARTRRKTAKQ